MDIPTKEECGELLNQNKTPSNVIRHSIAVTEFAEELCDQLLENNADINKDQIIASCMLHDIERVQPDHVTAGAKLLSKLGFPEIGKIIQKHGLHRIGEEEFYPKTYEEKIVFYADKRVVEDKVVTLTERFKYLRERYKKDFLEDIKIAKKIEEEIMELIKK